MPTLTDPAIQAQMQTDAEAGHLPVWDPNDLDRAQAFVDYFNVLTGTEAMELVTHTTYSYRIIPPIE